MERLWKLTVRLKSQHREAGGRIPLHDNVHPLINVLLYASFYI